jgi:undecaprenyl diphosphate synthase
MFGRGKRREAPAFRHIPAHIAIIMDGNGRWARSRGLPRTAGHSAGSETFRRIATHCQDLGVRYLTVYAFSTENWKRAESEVDAIMALLEKYLLEAVASMARDNVRLAFFGDAQALSPRLRALMDKTRAISATTSGLQVNVCLNYGGRAEITRAVRQIAALAARGELDPRDVSEETVARHLYSAGVPDPDLIIRPGGELRTSNFLPWQGVYSEYYFSDVLWPDFGPAELDRAIAEFNRRARRFGGTP